MPNPANLFVITDKTVRRLCYPHVKAELPPHKVLLVPEGEAAKTLAEAERIWRWLSENGADREANVLALGGGSVSDLAGFAAATYLRGIKWIGMPTTLLAMVDAAYGGKTGINLDGAKNQVGAFHAPVEVRVQPEFLKTLPYGQLLSGWAEVLKHTILHSEEAWAQFRTYECDDPAVWHDAIEMSRKVKEGIVTLDPHEQGPRRALNLGHTLGHALESFFLEAGNPILHGQAVALGLLGELFIATRQKICPPQGLAQVEETILSQYPLLPFEKKDIPRLIQLLYKDKKRQGNTLRYVAVKQPGTYTVDGVMTEADARAAFGILV